MPPQSENVRFQCDFEGTNGGIDAVDGSTFGNDPTFQGGALLSNTVNRVWFGITDCDWQASGSGAIEIPGILGTTFGTQDFTIEMFYRLDDPGGRDTIISIGTETAADKMLELQYDVVGVLRFRVSTDGLSFLSNQTMVGATNNTTWKYVVLQREGGLFCAWFRTLVDPDDIGVAQPVARALNNYNPGGNIHISPSSLYFGARGPLLGQPTEGRQGATRVTIGEAIYPGCPDEITLPVEAFFLACAPLVAFPIPDVTIFLGIAFSKDYSLYFSSPEGKKNTITATNLPTGFTIGANGVIEGAITAPEIEGDTFDVVVTATNECGAVNDTFRITVGTTVAAGGESFNFISSAS